MVQRITASQIVRGCVLLLLVALLGACASNPTHNPQLVQAEALPTPDTLSATGAYEGSTDYRLGAQGLLEISAFGVEGLTRDVRINAPGQLWLPLIGGDVAGGKTIAELDRLRHDTVKEGGYV